MPIFQYQATDRTGRVVNGQVHGASLDAALQDLSARGFAVNQLGLSTGENVIPSPPPPAVGQAPVYTYDEQAREGPPINPRNALVTEVIGPLAGKVSLSAQLFFFSQLGTMLNAGVNPAEALNVLGAQTQSPKLRTVIHEMRGHVEAGRTFSAGMQRYPEVFSPLTMSVLRAGEEGGFIERACRLIADNLEREINLRNLLRRVTIYPKLVIAASIIIISGTNVVIQMLKPGSSVALHSPLTTITTYFWLLPLLIGMFLFVRIGLHNPRIKFNWDAFVTAMPYVGKTTRMLAMARFGRALGLLYDAGVPPTKALALAADSCGNEFIRARLRPHLERLDQGHGITETLRRTGVFSPIVLNMTETGERTGNIDAMLHKVAEYYEGEVETRGVQMGWVIGVLALLIVSVYVVYVYATNMIQLVGGPVQEILKESK